MNLKAINLTDKQAAVLPHLINSSAGNGHDFGFTDEVPFAELGFTRQGFAGVIASILKRNDIIAEYHDLSEDPGIDCNSTQFVFAESFLDTVVHPAEDEMYNWPVQKEEPAEDTDDTIARLTEELRQMTQERDMLRGRLEAIKNIVEM